MLTIQQAQEYLQTVGVELPEFLLAALLDEANSINECLEAHYPPGTATLIQLYLVGLMALAQGDRYISSQSAPNGASRSFRYQSFADRWRGLMSLLRNLDKHGCAVGITPADPTRTARAFIGVAKGCCHE